MESAKQKIFLALGHVSMCWSETPKGIFESSKAEEIGNKLYDELFPPVEQRSCCPGPRTFKDELTQLINKYSIENESSTPDFILAKYLDSCLFSFRDAVRQRDIIINGPRKAGMDDNR